MPDPTVLHVSPDLDLPADAVTQTFAIVAMIGAGKSNAGAVLAEEFYAAGLPFVVIDPKGDWWGLRSSGDGTGPGLSIPIFGGLHGDLPLHEDMGRLVADLIVDQNLTCILDVSEFPSNASQMRFLTDFGDQLYRRHGKEPQPRHLIMEEADEYLPQQVRADQAKCVGVWTRIAKRGRQRGLGFTVITQRCASTNKDALSQCGTLIPLRTAGAHDRKAILDWVSYHDSPRDIVDSLPGLADGEAYAISPHWLMRHGQPAVQRFRFRQRWTFDSGATPEIGQGRRVATLADIDLGALEVRMAGVVEKAAADDPKRLRARVRELERKLATTPPGDGIRPADFAELDEDNQRLRAELAEALARPAERVEVQAVSLEQYVALMDASAALAAVVTTLQTALHRVAPPDAPVPSPDPLPVAPAPPRTKAATRPPAARTAPTAPGATTGTDGRLGKRERSILTVLAQFPAGRTHRQVALLTGYSVKASTIGAGLSALRKHGYVSAGGSPVVITPAGVDALGDFERLPSGPALLDYWNGQLGARERALLTVLLDRYPATVTHADMAEATGYSPDASTIGAGMSKLRGLGIADGWTASSDFVEAIHD